MKLRPFAFALTALVLSACQGEEPTASTTTGPTPQSFEACQSEIALGKPDPMLPWTPNAVKLVSEKIGDRVFAIYDANVDEYAPQGIPLATSGGFVIGDEGVLLVESMINRSLFCQAVALVQAQTDKPIRYVVNTSSHGDHSFGNVFLPEEVEIVQHEVTAAYIAEHFEDDLAFMKASFGGDGQGLDEIQPVAADILVTDAEPWSADLGGVTVEARSYGFAQTGGDLFVLVPSAKVVWTGNAIVAEKPAIPWLLDGHAGETRVTLAEVQAALPQDAIVIPGHGRAIGRNDIGFSVDYLDTLISEVGASVDQGLSQEQTVTAVTMEPFQGYALWGWVHSSINVPKTYGELSK